MGGFLSISFGFIVFILQIVRKKDYEDTSREILDDFFFCRISP